jgi:hypothetical protein
MPYEAPADIAARIERDYGSGAYSGIVAVLQPLTDGDRPGERDRVVRCVLVLAAGDIAKLRHYVGQAVMDYRDVIYWAEYDATSRIADYNHPFGGSQ